MVTIQVISNIYTENLRSKVTEVLPHRSSTFARSPVYKTTLTSALSTTFSTFLFNDFSLFHKTIIVLVCLSTRSPKLTTNFHVVTNASESTDPKVYLLFNHMTFLPVLFPYNQPDESVP